MAAIVDLRQRPGFGDTEERVVDATLRCIARWGVAKTTLDDVAREAGCSRATVYRIFPGGKDALMEGVARIEVERFLGHLGDVLAATEGLEERLVAGLLAAGRHLAGHQALQFLLAHEPEVVLPRLAFSQMDHVLAVASGFLAPYLREWIAEEAEARRAAEWLVRIAVSYLCTPTAEVDLTDPDSVRRLVRAFVLPGLCTVVTH